MTKVLIVDDQVLIRAGIAAILRAAPGYEVVGEACNGAEAVAMAEQTRPDVILMDIRMPDTDGIAATRRILAAARDRSKQSERDRQSERNSERNKESESESESENRPRILILTTFDLDEYVYQALRAGADGFVLKDTPPERLLAALKAVADGDTLFSPTVTRRLVQAYVTVVGPDAEQPGRVPVGAGAGLAAGPGTATSALGSSQTALVPRARGAEGAGSSAERAALAALTTRETDVLRLVATGLSNTEIAERLVVSEGTVKTHLNRAMAKLNLSSRAQAVVLAYESGLVVAGQGLVQG